MHGFEPYLMDIIATKRNFQISYRRPTDGGLWGRYNKKTGSYAGLKGKKVNLAKIK